MDISSFSQIILSAAKSAGAKVSCFVWTLFLLSLIGALCSTSQHSQFQSPGAHMSMDIVPRESNHRGVSAAACAALRLGLVTVHLLTHLLFILNYYTSTHTLCCGQELFLTWEICKTVGNTSWSCAAAGTSCGRALNPFQGKTKQVLCVTFSSGISRHRQISETQPKQGV